MCDVVTE